MSNLLKFGWAMPQNPAIWGAFGDYFGGILNPIIGLANLVVLIYLTFTLSVISGDHLGKLFTSCFQICLHGF